MVVVNSKRKDKISFVLSLVIKNYLDKVDIYYNMENYLEVF